MVVVTRTNVCKSYNNSKWNTTLYRHFFITLFLVLIISIFCLVAIHIFPITTNSKEIYKDLTLDDVVNIPEVILSEKAGKTQPRNPKCTYWDCFNVYRCGQRGHNRISVYVYPPKKYVDYQGNSATPTMSKEFYFILKTIVGSKYYTSNPSEACLFVPSIDVLNQNRLNLKLVQQALYSLKFWEDGENHIIFNMLAGAPPDYHTVIDINTSRALVAGAGFDTWTYRPSFDVSLPLYSTTAVSYDMANAVEKTYLVISSQVNMFHDLMADLNDIADASNDLLLLKSCQTEDEPTNHTVRCQYKTGSVFAYPEILKHGHFCIVGRGVRLAQPVLLEAMAAGCIPVIVMDSVVLPFQSVIDWHRTAVFVPEESLNKLISVLKGVSVERRNEMKNQAKWLFDNYFSSIEKITMTTLDIINDRVFPLMARSYEQWNMVPNPDVAYNPLFLPVTAPKAPGFTAVILTYDRVESLFTLVNKLVKTPSLHKVVVVWNNQKKAPPPPSDWPSINKPLKVIQTKENKLSNRFYPYDEIETECMLTIDDDIIMLTPDELEFGFEVWREFPDRIVGFPSRVHLWDNDTQTWKYHSEWTNQISMVLTGAAFHHKLWSWYYTVGMPGNIKEWVDENMNCEDIAMNFLVANLTNKPPIKVAPRKKFKCPECTNTEMLSADIGHMIERSACVDKLAKIYGRMALKTVEFRADPVLFRDNFPHKLKWFNDIGSL